MGYAYDDIPIIHSIVFCFWIQRIHFILFKFHDKLLILSMHECMYSILILKFFLPLLSIVTAALTYDWADMIP